MSRTRLPPPSELVEHCKLCAAVLELSVTNPRRVCAQCGEVNLPTDDVAGNPLRNPSPWVVPSFRGILGASSRPLWRAHGVVLSLQLAVVLVVAWNFGTGGKFDFGLLFVGLAFVCFAAYAAMVSVPVLFLKTRWQVLLLDCVAPLLTVFALWFQVGAPLRSRPPGRVVPAASPSRAPAPVPLPPRAPTPRAPVAPGWERSAMLASFSVAEEGTAFRVRFVPHFTGRLEVRAGHPQLIDLTYGRTTCEARAEETAECVMVLSRPQPSSGVRFELSALPLAGSRLRFEGPLTVVRVDSAGVGRPR